MTATRIECERKIVAIMSDYRYGRRNPVNGEDPLEAAHQDFIEWCRENDTNPEQFRPWFVVP